MIQCTAYSVMDAWDAHVVLAHVTPTGREWTQLAHDLIEGGSPDETPTDQLRRLARYLLFIAERQDALERG
jgi:hypothetical protein